jgi:phosphohistidine phosphatase
MTERSLVLLRHAKAEHPHGGGTDLDRRLTARGHADAAAAGAWLLNRSLVPELVLCSPARRTRQTWHAVATALGADARAVTTLYEPLLYHASGSRELLDLIIPTPADVSVVLVIGHNPLISMLSELLDPASGPAGGLRTSGIAVHQVPQPWHDGGPGAAPLIQDCTARA